MPWLETDVRDQRVQCVIAALRPGANKAAVYRAFGVSRKTGDKWLARYRAMGVRGLQDQSRRPHQSPTRTDATRTAQVRDARTIFGWGGAKLAVVLEAEGVTLSRRTIDRIIQREGLTRPDAAHGPAPHRFEHAAPNELWQLDAKGHYPVSPRGRCHPLSVLDDHSRYAVGLAALPTLTRAMVQPALVRCFEQYGLPRALLMDHGTRGGMPDMRPG
jgi:transposase